MTAQSQAIQAIETKRPSALIARQALAQAVTLANLGTDRKSTIPIVQNLLLVGDGGNLTISGNNLDVLVSVKLEAAADSDFATTIEAAKLRDILAKAKDSEHAAIDILPDDRAKVDLGGIQFTLQTIPACDFPGLNGPLPEKESFTNYSLATKDFKAALDRVQFAVSTEETRYYLNGIYIHGGKLADGSNGLHFVATDGHRLAAFELAADIPAKLPGIIVPRITIGILLKAIWQMAKAKNLPDTISIDCTASAVKFTLGHVEITSKIVDGTFPDYSRVIPRACENVAKFNCKTFAEAIGQVALVSNERGKAVKFAFWNGSCSFAVNNGAETAETVLQGTYSGDAITIGFNSDYIKDLLEEFAGDEFSIEMQDAGSPARILDLGEPRLLCVVMPLRV